MSNPYSTHRLWDKETLAAYVDQPTDIHGKKLGFVEANREAWRAWAARTPKHLWNPVMVQAYQELDRKK